MNGYEKVKKIGEGASGIVFKAKVLDEKRIRTGRKRVRNSSEPTYVAIKRIKLKSNKEGLSQEAIREIKILQELCHPNVVKILDIFQHHSNINLVMEFMETDLEGVIKDPKITLTRSDVKAYMKMLLEAVDHCHKRWILHRDIKPGNCLIGLDGSLHLTDFGLAKAYGTPDRRMTPRACTIWYRAPEMLYNSSAYGPAVDMWAVGCVFGELMTREALFRSDNTELNQLSCIFAKVGTPTDEEWPERKNLPLYVMYHYEETKPKPWKTLFPAAKEDAIDLMRSILRFNPKKRFSASEALKHEYFTNEPLPTSPDNMPTIRKRNQSTTQGK
mmetsp:Transcript_19998/g.29950  ORF Transcript_19998/g.29950 Transcript_19998/m.29950 type:complete len:329 (-) Transcript_19998:99-1085(-)